MTLKKKYDRLIIRYTMYDRMENILKKDNTTFTYELKTIRDLKDKMEKSIIKFLDDQDSEIIFEILNSAIEDLQNYLNNA